MSPASEHTVHFNPLGPGVTGEMWTCSLRDFAVNLTLMMMNGGELITLD